MISGFSNKKEINSVALVFFAISIGLNAADDTTTVAPSSVDMSLIGPINANIEERLNVKSTSINSLVGEQLSISTGSFGFQYTDETLLGNGPEIILSRKVSIGSRNIPGPVTLVGGWQFDLPHIKTNSLALPHVDKFGPWEGAPGITICMDEEEYPLVPVVSNENFNISNTQNENSDNSATEDITQSAAIVQSAVGVHEFYNGIHFNIPGKVNEHLPLSNGGVSQSGWKKRCYENPTENSKYEYLYTLTSPSGVTYKFEQSKSIPQRSLNDRGGLVYDEYMLVTNVTDIFGNEVNYYYDTEGSPKLSLIEASDGRKVSFKYSEQNNKEVSEIHIIGSSDETVLKKYVYTTGDHDTQSIVQRPDSSQWVYDFSDAFTTAAQNFSCGDNSSRSVKVNHPNGLEINYKLKSNSVKYSNLPYFLYKIPGRQPILYSRCSHTFALSEREVTKLNGGTEVWRFEFETGDGYHVTDYNGDPTETASNHELSTELLPVGYNPLHLKSTKATDPSGNYTIHYFNRDVQSKHLNREVLTQYFNNEDVMLREVRLKYDDDRAIRVNNISYPSESSTVVNFKPILSSKEIINIYADDSKDSFKTEFLNNNEFGIVTEKKEHFGDYLKYTRYSYLHDKNKWTINKPSSVEISNNGESYHEVKGYSYYSAEHESYPFYLKTESSYGREHKTYKKYYDNGTVEEIEFNELLGFVEGQKRRVVYGPYKMGQTTSISLTESKAHDVNITQTKWLDINELGQIESITDFEMNETAYTYDLLGRLKTVRRSPKEGEPNWLGKVYTWSNDGGDNENEPVLRVESCILDDSYSQCDADPIKVETFNYDGRFRNYRTDITDGTVTKASVTEYDARGRVVFKSPAFNPVTTSEPLLGTVTKYDGLGRVEEINAFNRQTITIEYLNQNRKRTTDSKGNPTTTSYLAYGEPSQTLATGIESPEGVSTYVDINLFGNVESITQTSTGDHAFSITENRQYDSFQRLCSITRPETGTKVISYDSSGRVAWYAEGLEINEDDKCSGQVDDGLKVTYTYDNLGAVYSVSYGDTSPTKTYTYDRNGNVERIQSDDFIQEFEYNSLGKIKFESLEVDTYKFSVNYEFNTLGYLSRELYEGLGYSIDYTPDAFGLPTSVLKTYSNTETTDVIVAEGASYYPNGTIKSFTYGNGVTHNTELTEYLLPNVLSYSDGVEDVVTLQYDFDLNNNVTQIINSLDGGAYTINELSYDGLDRLRSTSGEAGIGSSTLSYDGLGNIRTYTNTSVFNPSSLEYDYDPITNKLIGLSGQGSENYVFDSSSYDTRGNVIFNGKHSFVYNLAGEMSSATNSIGSYTSRYKYDGSGRRIKAIEEKGTSYSFYNSAGKLLHRKSNEGDVTYFYLGSKLVGKDSSVGFKSQDSIVNYKPFGESIEESKDDVGYTGHKFDKELGLNYMQARYYDPVIGRFYSNDPAGTMEHLGSGNIQGFNRYAYANNNPFKYVDPDGRKPDSIMSRQFAPLVKAVGNAVGSKSLVRVGARMTLDSKTMRAALTGDVKAYQAAVKEYKGSVGAYSHTTASGKTYDGKGTPERALASAKQHDSKEDPIVSSTYQCSGIVILAT